MFTQADARCVLLLLGERTMIMQEWSDLRKRKLATRDMDERRQLAQQQRVLSKRDDELDTRLASLGFAYDAPGCSRDELREAAGIS
jgi:hypothetical protein